MYKILVIDDEEILRERMKKLLMLDDFDVVVAEDGVRGIEVFKAEKPQVAIVDIKMPRMDGVEVLKQLKQLSEDVEVIMVTGHASLETALEALKLGAFDYIGKPVNYDELKLVVDRALENRDLKRRLWQQEAQREFFEKQLLFQLRSNLNMTKTLVGEQLAKLPAGEEFEGFRRLIDRIDAMFQLHGLLDPQKKDQEIPMQSYLAAIGEQLRHIFGLTAEQLEISSHDVALSTEMAITCGWIVRGILTFGFVGNASSPPTLPAVVSFAKTPDGAHELKVSIRYVTDDLSAKSPKGGTMEIAHNIIPLVTTCLGGVVQAMPDKNRCDFTITFSGKALGAL